MRLSNFFAMFLFLAPLVPIGAFAEPTDFKGLDLADEPKTEEGEKKKDEPKKEPAKDENLGQEKRSEVGSSSKPNDSRRVDVDITTEDRVKAVQRKSFLRRTRVELTPLGFVTLNDAFIPKYGFGGRLAFFFHDSFGLAARYTKYYDIPTDNVRLAKRQLKSSLPYVLPRSSLELEGMWSPIYGKVAVGNSIRTYDFYIMAGAGALWSQTSKSDGVHFSSHIGLGERFTLTDFLAVDLSVLDTIYADKPGGGNKSTIQQMISVNLGFSLYVPFSFEHKEP